MKVYRVDHFRDEYEYLPGMRQGPYSGDHGILKMSLDHNSREDHYHLGIRQDIPIPVLARILGDFKSYVCGFPSREKLYVWFKGWLPDLRMKGFQESTYEVPSKWVLPSESGNQLAFRSAQARVVARNPLKESNAGLAG